MSQTTITRRRQELEKEGYIKSYTLIPDFNKIGIEIIAFTLALISAKMLTPELLPIVRKWLNEQPEILCCFEGQGFDSNFVAVSVHKNYESYLRFIERNRNEEDPFPPAQRIQSFIIGTGKTALILKPFSLRQIESLVLPPETKPSPSRVDFEKRVRISPF